MTDQTQGYSKKIKKLLNDLSEKWSKLTGLQKTGVGVLGVLLLIVFTALVTNAVIGGNKVSATITVKSSLDNAVIANTSVEVRNITYSTDSEGQVETESIEPMLYEVNVFHPEYDSLTTNLDFNAIPFGGFIVFLDESGVATVTGTIVATNGILREDQIQIQAGDQLVNINDDGTFEITEVPLNITQVVVKSDQYTDTATAVNLFSGRNDLGEIEVSPAFDYSVSLIDFLTDEPVEGVVAEVDGRTYTSRDNGLLEIIDLDPQEAVQIPLVKTNYNQGLLSVDSNKLSQASESDDESVEIIELIPEGRILYTSEREGLSNVYTSDYDGGNEVKISNGGSDVAALRPQYTADGISYFGSSPTGNGLEVYTVENAGQTPTLVSDSSQLPTTEGSVVQRFYSLRSAKVLTYERIVEDTETQTVLTISNYDGSEARKIHQSSYDNTKKVVELRSFQVSDDGNDVAFIESQNNKTPFRHLSSVVYHYGFNTNKLTQLQEITQEVTSVNTLGISPDGDYIVTLDNLGGDQVVTVLNTANEKVFEYSNLAIFGLFAQMSEDSKYMYYLSERDGQGNVYRFEFQTGESVQITTAGGVNSFFVDSNDILQYQKGSELYLLDLTFANAQPVQTNISSNFAMWIPDGIF